MPNSTELKGVIQTSTTNSAHCDFFAFSLARVLEDLAAGGSVSALCTLAARSSTSALASRAASAAAASASISAVLLPSAMKGLLDKCAGARGHGWARIDLPNASTAMGTSEAFSNCLEKKLCVPRVAAA